MSARAGGKGGPKGVADGVNATVVVSTVAIIIVNMLITLIYTVFFPCSWADRAPLHLREGPVLSGRGAQADGNEPMAWKVR